MSPICGATTCATGDKIKFLVKPRVDFVESVVQLLTEIQAGLYADAKARLDNNIKRDVTSFAELGAYFGDDEDSFKGWVRVAWSRPGGAELEADRPEAEGAETHHPQCPADPARRVDACIFSGAPGLKKS